MENQTIASQNTQSTNATPSIQELVITPTRTNALHILAAVLISAIVFGLGGWYLGNQLKKEVAVSGSNQQITSQPSPFPTGDPSEVKTYTSISYGVSFQYPGDLEVKEFKDFGISLWKVPAPQEIPMEAPFPPIHIMILASKEGISAWVPDLQVLRTEKVKVGGIETDMTIGVVKPGPYYIDDVIYYTYLTHNGKYYLFRLDKQMYPYLANFYQEVLASFKFAN